MTKHPMDLQGRTFGRLTCISYSGKAKDGNQNYLCKCTCGKEVTVSYSNLKRNQSCGCYLRELVIKKNTKHGYANHPIYRLWYSILQRCTDPNNQSYRLYGGRGIEIFKEWENSFESFLKYIEEHLGKRPKDHSLDRIDNNKGYVPGNIRWAHKTIQSFNRNPRKNTKSGLRCITIVKSGYSVTVTNYSKKIHVGTFQTKEEAIEAYKKAAIELYGELPPEYK